MYVFDLRRGRVDTADGPLCLATHVECDLEQPSELELGLDAALKRTEDVDEGRLDRVLRFFAVAKSGKTECEDAPAVLFVQVPGQLGRTGRALRLSGCHLLAASARATGVAIARLRRWLTRKT
jgi:hypothetical protein